MIWTACVPCIEAAKDVYVVRRMSGNSCKDTCQVCGKRRFCSRYEVTERKKAVRHA